MPHKLFFLPCVCVIINCKKNRDVNSKYIVKASLLSYLFLPVDPHCDQQEQDKLGEAATDNAKPETLPKGTTGLVIGRHLLRCFI